MSTPTKNKKTIFGEIPKTIKSTLKHSPWAFDSQLLLAIRSRDVSKVAQLLEAGVDPNRMFAISSQHRTALSLAVESNDIAMVELLLRAGSSPYLSDTWGDTPLHVACRLGYTAVVELLLRQHGVNSNARTRIGETPLHTAAKQGSIELVEILLVSGASINSLDNSCMSALHVAADSGNDAVCQRLLSSGSDSSIVDRIGNTPLHYAMVNERITADTIEWLIREFPRALRHGNMHRATPLVVAIVNNRDDFESLLIPILKLAKIHFHSRSYSHLLRQRTTRGHTLLHLAVFCKMYGCIRVLLAAGIEVNSRDQIGQTPLASAVRDGSASIVTLLLSAGASTRTLVTTAGVNSNVTDPHIAEMLLEASRNPTKLTALCRQTVCKSYGLITSEFQLPYSLINFLNFNNIN